MNSSPVTAARSNYFNEDTLRSAFAGTRCLVTGGAGFVGSRLAERLLELGAHVSILDDFTTGREELVPPAAALHRGSVTDQPLLTGLVGEADHIFHLAARVLSSSTCDVRTDAEVNIGGMLNILVALRDSSRPGRRLVYSGTTSIYGNPSHLPCTEDERPSILSPYAASKYAAESYCHVFYELFNVPFSIVRYSNVYGPHQSPRNPYCGVISKFLTAAAQGQPLGIHGSGMQTRDFTYIDDAVTATLLAAVVPRAEGQIFNVGTGVETTILSLAETVQRLTGGHSEIQFIDRRDIDNVQRRVMNIEKARQVLRWIPVTHLQTGLERTLQWLRKSA
jgi:UDP-glucose 4-epimerase